MSIDTIRAQSVKRLEEAGYFHAKRELEIILSSILKRPSAWLETNGEVKLSAKQQLAISQAIKKRMEGQPLAYIVGSQPFGTLSLKSDNRALIPRPETEMLVEKLINQLNKFGLATDTFLEVGTGSGAIAISLKKAFPKSAIVATDISSDALELARENARETSVDITFIQSDLLASVPKQQFDVIVANLPYVPTEKLAFSSNQILDWEPRIAIDAGEDGLKYIRPFLEKIESYMKPKCLVGLEMWHSHGPEIQKISNQLSFDSAQDKSVKCQIEKDLAGHDRFAFLQRT